ncbi:predicted protein [Aspergillus terreus NIH2624]|uniref:Heterokaryon incompatibility domain-containing protein n=1 Tax=Aspergillus terreus (strain NIH 2624 / FGSC A1156) TaxID=341663 RepID=Q0C9K6_ASPTN|nr:uncharacterized protein ATEG_09628 [Aspergillus terreus NIH2624]EAU29819.1 predicted protein [Aspergillus terreus NIH2624]
MDAYQAFTSESKCVYPPVDPNLRQIRLVTIEPGNWPDEIKGSLHTFSLREQPAYEALSYVWGDPTHRKPIQLNSQIVEVTENLWTALRRLRKPSAPRVLWIDALCINQGDAEDKFSQVALMGEIFMGCAAAVLWLGEDPEVAETGSESTVGCRVSELLHTFQIEQHMFELPCFLGGERSDVKEDCKPHFEDLRMLLELPWWKRIWVVQEMVLPPQIQFMGIDDWPKEPPAQGSQQDSFWRTILNDSIPVAKEGGTAYIQPTDGHYRELHKLWKTLQVLLPFVGPTVKNEVENFARPWMVMDLVFSWSLIAYHVVVCLWQRRMFITEKGFVGLASKSVRAGDEVHILLGSPVPFILRPCRGAETYRTGDAQERLPTYTVVGNGYLHGIMFGEALEGEWKGQGRKHRTLLDSRRGRRRFDRSAPYRCAL